MQNLNNIARYNTATNSWGWDLNNDGLNGPVYALAVSGNNLYAGGYFTASGNETVQNLNNIARMNTNGGGWTALGSGLNELVYAIAVADTNVYAGGVFTASADGTVPQLNHIARFNSTTSSWTPLTHNGLNDWVLALTVADNKLFIGGIFTATADSAVQNLNYFTFMDKPAAHIQLIVAR